MDPRHIYLIVRYTFEDYNDNAPCTAKSTEFGNAIVEYPDAALWNALADEYDTSKGAPGAFLQHYEAVNDTIVHVGACRRRALFVYNIANAHPKLNTKHVFQMEGARQWVVSFEHERMHRNDTGWCVCEPHSRVAIFVHNSKVTPALIRK